MSLRALGEVPAAWTSKRPASMEAAFTSTSGGWMTAPAFVSAASSTSTHGRAAGKSLPIRSSARKLIDAVDAERIAARRGLGYPPPHYEQATLYDERRAAEGLYGVGARDKLIASGLWSETLTYEHRYVSEDVALGLTLLESAARTAGVVTPATSGLLGVFGTLLGRDLAGGRALDHLGLGDLTRREVLAFFHDGWASHAWSRVIR